MVNQEHKTWTWTFPGCPEIATEQLDWSAIELFEPIFQAGTAGDAAFLVRTDFEVGVPLSSATLSSGTRAFASG